MQAAGIDAFGAEVRLLELAAPASPAPDEVVISVRAAGVGNWDDIVRVGDWDVGRRPPLALGVEAAGVVAAVGEDVTSVVPGDEVLTHPLPLRDQGAWAEWLVAPTALVARKPATVPWEVAGAFPVPALTADQALTEAVPDPAGTWVLVHGAGGVTGGLAVQLAVARGATVVATAGPSSAARVGSTVHASSSTTTIPTGRAACGMQLPADTESRAPSTRPVGRGDRAPGGR
jgi:NADPH:quinone reductase-like Zn-dependent oxidoreductase